ncbi:phosphoribosyl pyrophosphokinase [Ramicandelaber brevisporus]|nr:phosphoribosyl pyrophosphokinase [Ramicandelaber brevisporus]
MRQTKVFAGSSHPELASLILNRLGITEAPAKLGRYQNSESSVELGVSVRNQDVYIIQSGSHHANDHLMELLVLINSCKVASARRITAVIPYFPYSKQSKMKKKRCAITAKLVANMLTAAGVDHIITLDLHASQMQGFFHKPIDNLFAEPTVAKWLKEHVPECFNASNSHDKKVVVVAKNAGGAKRVTSLADRLGADFALMHLEAVKPPPQQPLPMPSPLISTSFAAKSAPIKTHQSAGAASSTSGLAVSSELNTFDTAFSHSSGGEGHTEDDGEDDDEDDDVPVNVAQSSHESLAGTLDATPAIDVSDGAFARMALSKKHSNNAFGAAYAEEYRTPHISAMPSSQPALIGDARGKLALLMDDIIDKSGTFITAANHLVNNCGAKEVYIVAVHGILSGSTLADIEACPSISKVIVTNSFPIPADLRAKSTKLELIDISSTLAEAIRRTHNAESISYLFSNPL